MLQVSLVVVVALLGGCFAQSTDENQARQYIEELYSKYDETKRNLASCQWNLDTANKDDKERFQKELNDELNKYSEFNTGTIDEVMKYNWREFQDPDLKRKFFLWANYDDELLPPEDKQTLGKILQDANNLKSIRIKDFNSEEELDFIQMKENIDQDFENTEKLNYYWKEWSDKVGEPTKGFFTQWLSLKTKSAETNGYSTILEYWQGQSEVEDYEATMFPLLDEIEPLFKELHAYIRHRLREIYGDDAISPTGAIPVSFIVWETGKTPKDLLNRLLPAPGQKKWDIAPALEAKGIQGRAMFEVMDRFYQSIGFQGLPEDFYTKSIFEKQEDVDCGATAYDFGTGDDYRVSLCLEPTQESFNSAPRFAWIVEKMIAQKELSALNKDEYLPLKGGILNAITNLVNSPKYLKSLELLEEDFSVDKNLELNLLFEEALNWVFDTPFMLAYDLWRWHAIKSEIEPENYNCEYWNLRTKYQGVEPPFDRDNTNFDPGYYDAIGGEELVRNVMMRFMKYDIIWSLCTTAEGYQPNTTPENDLIFCDVHDNQEVGAKLKEAMQLGNTVPWQEALGKITGRNQLDATGYNEYFKPLLEWLQNYNKENNVPTGWPDHTDRCQ